MQDGDIKVNNDSLVEKTSTDSKIYELGYLLVPTIKEEDFAVVYGNLKELVSSFSSEIIVDEMPKMMNLAYSMQKITSNVRTKFNTAYFGWIKFVASAEQLLELKKRLDLDSNIIRFLLLKTVRENTIAAKRFVRSETYHKPRLKNTENETAVPINKEEIDKEIDALVGV